MVDNVIMLINDDESFKKIMKIKNILKHNLICRNTTNEICDFVICDLWQIEAKHAEKKFSDQCELLAAREE